MRCMCGDPVIKKFKSISDECFDVSHSGRVCVSLVVVVVAPASDCGAVFDS